MRSLFSWQQTQSSSRNQYCPCAFLPVLQSICPHQCLHQIWACPEGVHKTVFLWARRCRGSTAHTGTRQPSVETHSAPVPTQGKVHKTFLLNTVFYLDFSELYSRIPSAAPQICTKSSFVSFNKSAPGEQHKEIPLKEMEKELADWQLYDICLHS